jgi:hypothetical protein
MKKIILSALFASFLAKGATTNAYGTIVPSVKKQMNFDLEMFFTVAAAVGLVAILHNAFGHWVEHHGRGFTGIAVGQEGK